MKATTSSQSPPSDRDASAAAPSDGAARVIIDAIRPAVDGGRTRIKRVVGDVLRVEADLLVDGHDHIDAVLLYGRGTSGALAEAPLAPLGNDRWVGSLALDAVGVWRYTVEAWVDAFATWRWGVERKAKAGQDIELELREGAALVAAAAARARDAGSRGAADAEQLRAMADELAGGGPAESRLQVALDDVLAALMRRWPDRSLARRHTPLLAVVDPLRARFSAWYEMFPRSAGPPGRHASFRDAESRLPYVAGMGFDVLYLPPIHPIGKTHRKGPNNTLKAGADDPGSPWAIGAAEGGHKAVHPQLGTLEDFRRFVTRARELGLEVALDIAFQASPDHPYVREHPDWFVQRLDGSIRYAENPPKKYQDVYPFHFGGPSWRALWDELLSVFLFWAEQGVRIFRVDNPHTKPLPFWRWCLQAVKEKYPEALFLSEAFTRPKLMYALAKAGFSQSYTYFTWRNSKAELAAYLKELTTGEVAEFFRPNLWPNTPDILPETLQVGTRATFIARVVLAGTLSASYGIYGPPYELMERAPRPDAEEYLDNEKYQLRQWDIDRADSLRPILKRLNEIRRENPALQGNRIAFHKIDNELLIAYSKTSEDGANVALIVVSLDPQHRQAGWLDLDLAALGVEEHETFQVHDLLGDARYLWRGRRAYVELDAQVMPAHIFRIRRKTHTERTFEYYL